MRKTRAKRRGKVSYGLHAWNYGEKFNELASALISEAVREGVEHALGYKVDVWFPSTFGADEDGIGGRPPKDKLAIYVALPLGESDDPPGPIWHFTLDQMVDDLLVWQSTHPDVCNMVEASDIRFWKRLLDEFKRLAERLEKAIAQEDEFDRLTASPEYDKDPNVE
jgi:hypothetical protein